MDWVVIKVKWVGCAKGGLGLVVRDWALGCCVILGKDLVIRICLGFGFMKLQGPKLYFLNFQGP